MYKLKPIQEKIVLENLPNCMYQMKPYFNENQLSFDQSSSPSSSSNLSLSELEELSRKQEKQFKRLQRLLNKSNELCEDLSLDHLVINLTKPSSVDQTKLRDIYDKQEAQFKRLNNLNSRFEQLCQEMNKLDLSKTTKSARKAFKVDLSLFKDVQRTSAKVLNKEIVDDYVFHCDPCQSLPVNLLNYFNLLTQSLRCFIKFHTHGSLSSQFENNFELENRLLNIVELFDGLNLGLNESRNRYDYGFTFIWTKSSEGVELRLSDGSVVVGEDQIVQKLNSLLPESSRVADDLLHKRSQFLDLLKSF